MNEDTWLKLIKVQNFRQFTGLELTFDPSLTVIVAPNGGGKTAVLDATAAALRPFVDKMLGKTTSQGFKPTDARLTQTPEGAMVPQFPVHLTAEGYIAGQKLVWERDLSAIGGRMTSATTTLAARAETLVRALQAYADKIAPSPPVLPLIAYYGTGRLWAEERISQKKKQAATNLAQPTDAYRGCLSPSLSYDAFVLWYERVVREAQNEQSTGIQSPHRPQAMLEAVRGATDEILRPTGWRRIDWDFLGGAVIAEHPTQGRLPVSLLSDGIRNMIALVADLAHRAVRLNPHHGKDAVLNTPGTVLVDEVDMHLHPEWQQRLPDALQSAFPRVQWIVTTHSPQVISAVRNECLRVLRADLTLSTPDQQTRGVESAALLAEVMGVDPIPPVAEAKWVADYKAYVESDKASSPEAMALWARVMHHFGEQHPVVLECERLLRWQAFKRTPPKAET